MHQARERVALAAVHCVLRSLFVVNAAYITYADAVAIMAASVSAHNVERPACLYDAVEPNNVVVSYVAPAAR